MTLRTRFTRVMCATAGVAAVSLGLIPAVAAPAAAETVTTDTYQPDWDSLSAHEASPEWFKDAKFGVYWHWGAFSVPAYGSEWYGREMYAPGTGTNTYHTQTYGDPTTEFGYDKFITGGVDKQGNTVKFAPKLASEGGQFDPEAWMDIVASSGAKFAGPVAEHHDGFSMWDSQVNEWNSVDKGPNLDLLQIFADEVRSHDMKLLVAMHQAFNYNGFYRFAPQQTDPSLQKLYGQLSRTAEDQLWYDKQNEVINEAQPDIIWNDFSLNSPGYCHGGDVCAVSEEQRLNFLSTYFNKGEEWNKEVVTTYKHFDSGFRNDSAVEDYERGGPAGLTYPYWLTDDAISSSSWSYTNGIGYYSSKQMIHSLIDRVSKNGNMLLNISPTAAGTIPAQQQQVLADIGTYLTRNGEAVYSTRAWDVYGEGTHTAGGGSFTAPLEGDATDIRFTRDKAESVLYATVLGWPGNGQTLGIKTLGGDTISLANLQKAELLGEQAGQYIPLTYAQTPQALNVTMPAQKPGDAQAYVVKLTFNGTIPTPQQAGGASFFPTSNGTGNGLSVGSGQFNNVYLTEAGAPQISSLRVSPGTIVRAYSADKQTGTVTTYGPGVHAVAAGSIVSASVSQPITGTKRAISIVNGFAWDADATATPGSNVLQNTANTADTGQVFDLQVDQDGYVKIIHHDSGLAIDGMGLGQGTYVQLQQPSNATSQQFEVIDLGNGATNLVNRATGLALDSGGGVAVGSPLKQWGRDGSPNLSFTLNSVTLPSTIDISAVSSGRLVAGKAVLTIQVTNDDTVPVNLTVATPYGTRTVTALAPGKKVALAFSTRVPSYSAGTATITATAVKSGSNVTRTLTHNYAAFPAN